MVSYVGDTQFPPVLYLGKRRLAWVCRRPLVKYMTTGQSGPVEKLIVQPFCGLCPAENGEYPVKNCALISIGINLWSQPDQQKLGPLFFISTRFNLVILYRVLLAVDSVVQFELSEALLYMIWLACQARGDVANTPITDDIEGNEAIQEFTRLGLHFISPAILHTMPASMAQAIQRLRACGFLNG